MNSCQIVYIELLFSSGGSDKVAQRRTGVWILTLG